MAEHKYLIMKEDYGLPEVFVFLFDNKISHRQFAMEIIQKLNYVPVWGGRFAANLTAGYVSCYGITDMAGVRSREEDCEIIKRFLLG